MTVLGLAPLADPRGVRLPRCRARLRQIALRVWPFAALVVFYQPAGTFPFHAFQGLPFPLVVLALLALRAQLGERPLPLAPAIAVAALLIVPGTLYQVDNMRDAINRGFQAHFLEPEEHDALR